ncbi:16S rRNA (guanine(527)-N(7))-methyltransferase RsmG [Corynebacterium sp. ES2794-CONJ1]|uniref:16S rRNA (guanine(527)-N(7))-methyltransferase RsmG n=1 Tax=unclassified Corynebacterium TaxID=2624378 RepID=UPI002168ACFC|nr:MULTISPECIES: 16S rRNA (guanine(527)-N(7))-methyltransferase RsmG [unclassified Corynebacterium]MCS4490458.1 16S rRNA (guanine(527)-N(7))-methyltransferase RsmG [Corynebacterium sp. ES2775-CONJ]MCS4492238.1 16S rRNA (guanine(527)-N(7))-methyltransferase RsmG [Corynebacterium sp. ES2715-CONJ3]MCS4532278.1 16S rRNA (guanine(527)-N(7))-methyltransferase RsmG [Corynebacterium sp. ES2730-CONJ]MCU9519757.1 16S rRNA (guanine(527)-N(7))-methyltransferase RsmG [Corynebacterium sp. ES2794-CONJ1]
MEKAQRYHQLLATMGLERGFLGPRELPRLWDRHILNCAVIGEAIKPNMRVADIGSGAGLPGIPLAIARPDLDIVLIEPLLKRSEFLKYVAVELDLNNIWVLRGRAEEKEVRREVGGVDIVTSRAVAPLGKLAGWSLPLVDKGGRMLALKGSSVHEEIERDKRVITKAGGADIKVFTVGEILPEPTTVVSIRKNRSR